MDIKMILENEMNKIHNEHLSIKSSHGNFVLLSKLNIIKESLNITANFLYEDRKNRSFFEKTLTWKIKSKEIENYLE